MRFTYLLPGWECTAHDGRVIKDAVRRGFKPPPGCYYLADAGYSNTDMWLTPYRSVRYHLRKIKQADKKPEEKYELFNYRHSSLCNVIERTFGVFKRCWWIYDRAPELPMVTQVKLFYVLAAIHNHISINADADFDRLSPARDEAREQRRRERDLAVETVKSEVSMNEQRERIADMMWESYKAYIEGDMRSHY